MSCEHESWLRIMIFKFLMPSRGDFYELTKSTEGPTEKYEQNDMHPDDHFLSTEQHVAGGTKVRSDAMLSTIGAGCIRRNINVCGAWKMI